MKTQQMASHYCKECPECDAQVDLHGTIRLGQIVTCAACRTHLAITQVDPLKFDWAFLTHDIEDVLPDLCGGKIS